MPRTAKVFMSGRSQAVRLPAEFRFETREVFIEKKGDMVLLKPKPEGWAEFFDRTAAVPSDFLSDREDLPAEPRKLF